MKTRAQIRVAALILGTVGTLASACSSSDGDAFGEFVGTWRIEFGATPATQSSFALNCTTFGINDQVFLWDKLVFEPGTVSDLTETSGPSNCQFPFKVMGKVASVPAIDPFTGLAPSCSSVIDTATVPANPADPLDTTVVVVDLVLQVRPVPWKFSLIQPVKGQPPTAKLEGTSTGVLGVFNETSGMFEGGDDTCVYTVAANATKIAND